MTGAGLSLASCARLPSENSTEFSLRSPRSFEPAACAGAALAAAFDGLLPNRSPSSSDARWLVDAAANRSPGSLRTVPASSLPPPLNIAATAALPPPPTAAVALPEATKPANVSTCAIGSQSAKPSRQMYVSASISPAVKRCCTSPAVIGPT